MSASFSQPMSAWHHHSGSTNPGIRPRLVCCLHSLRYFIVNRFQPTHCPEKMLIDATHYFIQFPPHPDINNTLHTSLPQLRSICVFAREAMCCQRSNGWHWFFCCLRDNEWSGSICCQRLNRLLKVINCQRVNELSRSVCLVSESVGCQGLPGVRESLDS